MVRSLADHVPCPLDPWRVSLYIEGAAGAVAERGFPFGVLCFTWLTLDFGVEPGRGPEEMTSIDLV